jgi:hypothetical protein
MTARVHSWTVEDLSSHGIAYWLPPGGRDNGVWADMWGLLADLEPEDADEVLARLAAAEVAGYVAIAGGRRARATGPVRPTLWVDLMQYGRGQDVLIRFMQQRDRQRADGQPAVSARSRSGSM